MSGETKKSLKSVVCAGMVTLFLAGCARANAVDSNSVVKDGIEYYMQTDKSVYSLGENVEMLYRVTNLSYSSVTFEFAYIQQWFFEVRDGATRIWGWPKLVNPAFSSFTLEPGDVKGYFKEWDMMNDNTGSLVIPGTYNVVGALDYGPGHPNYVPVSAQIEIVEGPYCGDANHPYPAGDVNHDCKVNLLDLVILASHWLEDNTPVNSNSIVKDGIEYYMQTDRFVYRLGENVEMLYRVTNLRDEDVIFAFGMSPEWNFWVEKHRENIWRAVEGWWAEMTQFTLGPGDSKEFPALSSPYIWDMRDDEDNLVNVGKYNVIGGLDAGSGLWDFTRVSVGIKIVP